MLPLPLPPVVPQGLTPQTLTVQKEKTYFTWVLVISILLWLAFAATLIGPIYAAIFGLFIWLGNGLLIAYLRSEAVRVSPDQLPELDATFRDVCARLELRHPPALYVLQSGGLLNAFATRFSGRNFVVVYSEMLEALGPSSPEMRFILGHEVGHIQSNHVLKHLFLAPGLFFPLVGPAYRRAWETSCDRYGAFAAQDVNAALRAMLVLSGGRGHGPTLSAPAFAQQHVDERGFFVSLHELTSTYPTLSRRVSDLMALADGQPRPAPKRHGLAYFVALLMPGGNSAQAGPAGVLLSVVFIGFMAALAVPAFAKVRQTASAAACVNNQRQLQSSLEQYLLEHGKAPQNWADVLGAHVMPACPEHGTYKANVNANGSYTVTCSIPGHAPEALHRHR